MGSALLVQLCILSQIGFFRENANTLKNLVFTFPMKFQFCHFWSCPLQRVFTLQRAVTGHSGNTGTSHHQPHTRLNSKAYACVCIVTCNENVWRCSLQWPMCDVWCVVCCVLADVMWPDSKIAARGPTTSQERAARQAGARPGPAQSFTIRLATVDTRAANQPSRRFYNHKECWQRLLLQYNLDSIN